MNLIRQVAKVLSSSQLWVLVAALGAPLMASAQSNPLFDPQSGKPQGCIDPKTMKTGPCPDSQLFIYEGQRPVELAFNASEFKELDRLYAQWCKGTDRLPDGRWNLAWYSRTLYDNMTIWKQWDLHLARIKSWQKAAPDSEAAKLAEAIYWRAYGWYARGPEFANTVAKEAWPLFNQRLEKSLGILQSIGSNCASKFPVTIDAMTDLGVDEAEIRKTYDEAVKKFPQYHSIYFAMARHYDPIWGGTTAGYERFADEATAATESFEGKAMYARLYWLVDRPRRIPFTNSGTQPPAWPKLKKSLEDLTTRYPNSQANLGQFLSVACRSSDSALYRQIRTKLGGYAEAAQTFDSLEICDLRHKWTPENR